MTSLLPFRWHIAEVLFIVAAGVGHRVVVTSARERRLALVHAFQTLIVGENHHKDTVGGCDADAHN